MYGSALCVFVYYVQTYVFAQAHVLVCVQGRVSRRNGAPGEKRMLGMQFQSGCPTGRAAHRGGGEGHP